MMTKYQAPIKQKITSAIVGIGMSKVCETVRLIDMEVRCNEIHIGNARLQNTSCNPPQRKQPHARKSQHINGIHGLHWHTFLHT